MPCFAKRAVLKKPGDQTQVVPRTRKSNRHQDEAGKRRTYRQDKNKKVQKIQRATGAEGLENCRFGPEVIIDFTECTPIPLWNCVDPLVEDFASITTKTSADIIPASPKPTTLFDAAEENEDEEEEVSSIGRQRRRQRTPPMSWDPNLTVLEEEEFGAEAALIKDHFKLAYCLPLENETHKFDKNLQVVQILRPDGSLELKDRIRVIIKENKTEFLLHIGGRLIVDGTEEAEEVKKKNEKYVKVCDHHAAEPDLYCERASQTFTNTDRNKYTQLVGVGVLDKSQLVNDYIMFDDYNELQEKERLQKARDEEEAMIQSLAESQEWRADEETFQGSSDEDDSDEEDKQKMESKVEWNKIDEYFAMDEKLFPPDDMNDLDEDLAIPSDEELDVKEEIDELYAKRLEKVLKSRPKLLPNISYSALILERVLSTIKYQKKQMEVRGFEPIFRKELTRRQMYHLRNDALVESGATVRRFWAYKPNLTKGLEVTSISVHPTNGNIIAASYGSNGYPPPNAPEGLVCIWNLKNIIFPERTYRFEASVTIVVFSNLTPYLLAIGLLDGNIFVYDVRSSVPRVYCTTEKMLDRPFGPIWDLFWLQETEMASAGTVKEVLVSVSDDGCLYRWTSAKGFEPWVLLKVRRSPLKIPGRKEKRAEALISQWSATYTVCFYPDDLTTYLIGTEEGFIHKCTTSYAEQFMVTYVSHTGPVYSIRFSPFAKDIFMSCGGDWYVKIWKEDFPSAPLLTICTGLRTVFDVAWAPSLSSVFVSANELHIEIWDLTVNTLEPIIQFKLPNLGLRRVSFYNYLQGLLVGDNDGGITVYALRNFPVQPTSLDDKIDHLLEGLIPGYKRKMNDEKPDAVPEKTEIEATDEHEEDEEEEEEWDEEEEDVEDLEGTLQAMLPVDPTAPTQTPIK